MTNAAYIAEVWNDQFSDEAQNELNEQLMLEALEDAFQAEMEEQL